MTTPEQDPLETVIQAGAVAYDQNINDRLGNPPGRVGVAEGLAQHPSFRAAIRAAVEQDRAEAEREWEAATDRLLAETGFEGMEVNDRGVRVMLRQAFDISVGMCDAFKTWLDLAGAENYVEQSVTDQRTAEKYIVIICRPRGRTPHQLRRAAEERLAEAERELAELRGRMIAEA